MPIRAGITIDENPSNKLLLKLIIFFVMATKICAKTLKKIVQHPNGNNIERFDRFGYLGRHPSECSSFSYSLSIAERRDFISTVFGHCTVKSLLMKEKTKQNADLGDPEIEYFLENFWFSFNCTINAIYNICNILSS